MAIQWDDGRLLTLNPGDTATCTKLTPGQLYGLFFYNSAEAASDALVYVTRGGFDPDPITVPGTTGNRGLASVAFVSSDDATTVSAALASGQQSQVQVFICSQAMPTNTSGINLRDLPVNGQNQPFSKFTRYYAVLPSNWHKISIGSSITQFTCVEFKMQTAQVIIVNARDEGANIYPLGSAGPLVNVTTTPNNKYDHSTVGNGRQLVWMNADSVQDSQSAYINAQSLTVAQQAVSPDQTVGAR